jgi:hypothetical protein
MFGDGYRYYKSEVGNTFEDDKKATEGTIYHNLVDLSAFVMGTEKPDGGEKFPAKDCKDLKLCHPDSPSGEYYIDPNMGAGSDKFQVDCVFDKKKVETCIRPKKSHFATEMDLINEWRFLIHDLEHTQEIAYDADVVALRYMRLNSMKVRQNITYHCFNQHAHRDSNGVQDQYIMVKTADGSIADTRTDKHSLSLDVIKDACNQRDGKWHSATFELSTSKLYSLPITDIKIRHTKPTDVKYEPKIQIELGPICFT